MYGYCMLITNYFAFHDVLFLKPLIKQKLFLATNRFNKDNFNNVWKWSGFLIANIKELTSALLDSVISH